MERDLLIKLGLCLDPYDPASASIADKALRSLRPSAGHNRHDAEHRRRKGQSILKQALVGDQIPDHGIFPGLGDRWPDISGERSAILVPKKHFERITEKIVRGIIYVEDGRLVQQPYKIEFFVFADDATNPWMAAFDRCGKVYAREPGIVVRRVVAEDDGLTSLFEVKFWRQFKTYASVTADGDADTLSADG
ncbi:hypothetical protein AUC68_15010 [Methyloceanibacter methanicus]|uniref:Uncharacterized protein n=1 Tax=Methyloceanibacter methanicus TaxID=1774968 RepID=A0A1E3W441_9HYPH|nr:hypothetical protein AUC68_15010 [Methyloceanibacter methanicus]